MMLIKFAFIFIAIVFSVVEGNKPTEANDEVIKRNKDINQVFGKYNGAMIEKQSETAEDLLRSLRTIKLAFANCNGQHIQGAITAFSRNCKRFQEILAVSDLKPLNEKRYQDINQAFGQYSGPMIGKRSVAETKESDEVIKRYQDINQAFGQYTGDMYGKRSVAETKESDEVIKRYQDINQAFGQYSGAMIGKKSVHDTKENEIVIKKRYQDINQAFGQYSGAMIGRRVQTEDKSTTTKTARNFNIAFGNCQNGQSVDGARVAFSNCGGAQSTQGIFGQGGFFSKQQKGFGYGKRSVASVETSVPLNETKKDVDENERQSRQYSSPVSYQQCLLLSTSYYNPLPVYYSYKPVTQQVKPIVYTSVNTLNRVPEVQIGGVYTGAMIGKRSTESILDKCRRTYPSLQYKQYTTYTTTPSSYYQQTYTNNGLFSVFDNFKYIFGKRDAVKSE